MKKLSDQGIDLLTEREAIRNYAYLDTADPPVWTIGIGHTGPEVHDGLYWTDGQVKAVFAVDVGKFEDAINNALRVPVEQHQFDALVSWAFNVGTGAAASSTLIRRINEGNLADVPFQFDRWHIPPSITSRRNGEREQFKGAQFVARL